MSVSLILLEGCFLVIFYVVGIAIVAALIAVFLQLRLSKTPPFILVIHLQFLMLYRLFFCLTHNLPEYFETYLYNEIKLPYAYEKLCSYADQLAWYLVLFNHMMINIYRYFATCKPAYYSRVKDKRIVLISLAMTWIASLLLVVIPSALHVCCAEVFHYHVDGDEAALNTVNVEPIYIEPRTYLSNNQSDKSDIYDNGEPVNLMSNNNDTFEMEAPINAVRGFTAGFDIACLIFMFLCYCQIIMKLRAVRAALSNSNVLHSAVIIARIDRNERERRMAVQFFVMTVIFTILVLFVFILQFVDRTSHLISALFLMYGANAFGDAVVMFWFNPKYIKVAKAWIPRKAVGDTSNPTANQVDIVSEFEFASSAHVNSHL